MFNIKRDLTGVANMLAEDEDILKTIIFCRTKNDCAKIYGFLCKSGDKHAVSMYHSSLTQGTKTQIQENFKSGGQLRCLSATVAFGMVNCNMNSCVKYTITVTVM